MTVRRRTTLAFGFLALAALLIGGIIELINGRLLSAAVSAAAVMGLVTMWIRRGRGDASETTLPEPTRSWSPTSGYLLLVAGGSLGSSAAVVFLFSKARTELAAGEPAGVSVVAMLAGLMILATSLVSLVFGLVLKLKVRGDRAARWWFVQAATDVESTEDSDDA